MWAELRFWLHRSTARMLNLCAMRWISLKGKLGSSVIVLATVNEGKVVLVAGVSADLLTRMKAGEIAGAVAAQVGGKGGGRADFAQAGGTQPENLGKALAGVETLIRSRLSN